MKYKYLTHSKSKDSAYCKYGVFYAPLEVGKSGGQAANKFVTWEFSKWLHAEACFEKRQKENYQVNSVSVYEKFLD